MKKQKPKCPICEGSDLDIFPEGFKFGYCYTCKQSVEVDYSIVLTNKSEEKV